ncbi:MAG: hypothetical protein KIG96_03215 [Treponema sp.]|nr:hypothetical protein [Treponema sp.]
MDNKENSHFDEINALYFEYASLKHKENVENKLQSLKTSIIVETCKMFHLDRAEYHYKDINYQEYAEEIFIAVKDSLEYYKIKTVDKIDEGFAKYLITSVKKKVKFAAAQGAVEEKNTMDIPRDKILLLRRIKKENDQLFRLGIKNQEKRFFQIQRNLGLSDKDCKELIPLALNETVSLEKSIGNEDDGASIGDFIGAKAFSPQEMIDKRDALVEIFELIQKSWKEFKDPETRSLLSDALTADILEIMFDSCNLEGPFGKNSSEYENMDVFENYSFINLEMVKNYFNDSSYKLPNLTEIGLAHGGMSKSGVSKKIKRFYELIKK